MTEHNLDSPTLYYPSRQRSRNRWPIWFFILFASALLVMVTIAGLGLIVWLNSSLIAPGVHVLGVDLGGLSTAEAELKLRDAWQRQSITIQGGEYQRGATPNDLGIRLDMIATVGRAYQHGRTASSAEFLISNGRWPNTPMSWNYDLQQAKSLLELVAPELYQAPVNATIQVIDGQVSTLPAVAGRELDIDSTLALLGSDPQLILETGFLPLVLVPVSPEVVDVSAVAAEINDLLNRSLVAHIYDPISGQIYDQPVSNNTWAFWLKIEINQPDQVPGAGSPSVSWSLDANQVQKDLDLMVQSLGPGAYLDLQETTEEIESALRSGNSEVNLRLYHHDRQHMVEPGQTLSSIGRAYGIPYPWIMQANPGLGDNLYAGQTIIIPSPDELLPLPIVPNKRIVVSIPEQRVRVYENNALKWDWPASTGIDESPTAPGIFQIQSHEINAYASNWELWMPHFMGVYRPVPYSDFMNGFHGFPTRNGNNLLWTGDLGHKVTYGCILVSSENAAQLYDWAEEGVVVEITS